MLICIQQFLEADFWQGLGVIFTAVLTTLIIFQSFKISRQQKKFQQDIQKKNEDLQKDIATNNRVFQERIFDDNAKIALYKYRANCYLTVIEATDLFFELGIKVPILFLQRKDTSLEILNNLSRLKSILFKASHEARVLFSKEVYDCYEEHRNLSIKLYNLWFSIIVDTENLNQLQEKFFNALQSVLNVQNMDIVQFMALLNNNTKFQSIMDEYPAVKDFLETEKKLNELFHSNKIDTLVESYIDVKQLGNRKQSNI